jgi:hypothetical protein
MIAAQQIVDTVVQIFFNTIVPYLASARSFPPNASLPFPAPAKTLL